MTRPIMHAARVAGVWYVCLSGRYGVGDSFRSALKAALLSGAS